MDWTIVISILCFVGFFIALGLIIFWVYGLTPIIHRIIKSNGTQARAKILEVRKAGWGWYAGGQYSQSLVFQPIKVKLEVHPNNGAPYIAHDRFNAKPKDYRENIKPGVEMQVAVSSFSPQWVASLPETIVTTAPAWTNNSSSRKHAVKASVNPMQQEDYDASEKLEELKDMLDSNLITPQDYEKKKAEILAKM